LLHELAHVYANLYDYEEVQLDLGIKIPNNDNEAERKVIEGIETSAAKFWGEGVRTIHYIRTDESGYYCTTDPTSFQKSLVIENSIDQ